MNPTERREVVQEMVCSLALFAQALTDLSDSFAHFHGAAKRANDARARFDKARADLEVLCEQ